MLLSIKKTARQNSKNVCIRLLFSISMNIMVNGTDYAHYRIFRHENKSVREK